MDAESKAVFDVKSPQPLCALVQKMLAGSDEAAWKLAEEVGSYIRRVARRHSHTNLGRFLDSDDYVQNVWASVFRIAPRLRNVKTDEELLALLASMARNRVIDQTRQHTRTMRRDLARTVSLSSATTISVATDRRHGKRSETPSAQFAAKEKWEAITQRLSPVHREIARLRLKGHTYVEIADKLSISKRTVTRVIERMARLASDEV